MRKSSSSGKIAQLTAVMLSHDSMMRKKSASKDKRWRRSGSLRDTIIFYRHVRDGKGLQLTRTSKDNRSNIHPRYERIQNNAPWTSRVPQ